MEFNRAVNMLKIWFDADGFNYDEERLAFVDIDDELEYGVETNADGSFKGLIMRFTEDPSHSYLEFRMSDYNDDIAILFYDATDEDMIDDLEEMMLRKRGYIV